MAKPEDLWAFLEMAQTWELLADLHEPSRKQIIRRAIKEEARGARGMICQAEAMPAASTPAAGQQHWGGWGGQAGGQRGNAESKSGLCTVIPEGGEPEPTTPAPRAPEEEVSVPDSRATRIGGRCTLPERIPGRKRNDPDAIARALYEFFERTLRANT
jgi:hypothetical protein